MKNTFCVILYTHGDNDTVTDRVLAEASKKYGPVHGFGYYEPVFKVYPENGANIPRYGPRID